MALLHRAIGACLLFVGWATMSACDTRPNIIFLLTDDQDSYLYGDAHMPKLAKHLANKGINFTHSVTNYALCCPSRAAILTGQCAHNNGVASNFRPLGGMQRFNDLGLETKTGPYLLQQAGYRTGLVGKYLNVYDKFPASYIPPGYDYWLGVRTQGFYNWTASDNGVEKFYGSSPRNYSTDVITRHARRFIEQYENDPRPMFLYVAPYAPHSPYIPAEEYVGTLAGLTVPRFPSYNESDESIAKKVSPVINTMRPYTRPKDIEELDAVYQARAETLLSVDDQIKAIVDALRNLGQLDNTYFFYTSDNGFKLGHRRKTEKFSPYEEDIRVPLYVRGPDVPWDLQLPHLIANIDFVPTWLDLAGVPDPYAAERDGKSFASLLRSQGARALSPDDFRIGVLIEKLYSNERSGVVSTMVPIIDRSNDIWASLRPMTNADGTYPEWVVRCETAGPNDPVCRQLATSGYTPDRDERALGSDADWEMAEQLGIKQSKGDDMEGVKFSRGDFSTPYYGLRIQSTRGAYKLIQYPQGFELYDLNRDPYEVDNYYDTAPKPLVDYLMTALDSLKACRGENECSIQNVTLLVEAKQLQR